MNTFLSSSQEALKEQYFNFAGEVVAAAAASLESRSICLREFLQELGQKGYLGINVPAEYGGQGGTLLSLVFFVEAVSQWEPGLGLTLSAHAAAIELLKRFGDDRQKSRYLPLLARGDGFATLAFSEEMAGTDFAAVESLANKSGNDFVLSGKKTWVVSGDFATVLLVLVKKGDADGDLGLFIVEAGNAASYKVQEERALMGLCSAHINDIEFDKFKLSSGSELKGAAPRQMALYAMNVAKTVLAAAAVGLTESCRQYAVEHARQRQQFGQNIGQFQGVQWKLADMEVDLSGARLQTYRAAWSHDEDLPGFARNAAIAKLLAPKAARFHSGEAMQIMGAAGLAADHPLARLYRGAKIMEICQGTAEFQKMLLSEELGI